MAIETCAYCGGLKESEREHAVPINLFPPSIRHDSRFILVPSCGPCNRSFSSDEEDFRNYCALAGPENSVVLENFHGPVLRGIRRNEGRGSGERLFSMLEFVERSGQPAVIIRPNAAVFRIVRKIVRGLAFARWGASIPDCRVHAEPFPYVVPPCIDEFDEGFNQVHPTTFRFWCEEGESGQMHSGWFVSIYRTRNFAVRIFESELQRDNWLRCEAEARRPS